VKQLIIILALLAVGCSDNFRELNCESSSDGNRSYIFNNQSVQVITSEDEASWSCDYFRQTQDFLRCKVYSADNSSMDIVYSDYEESIDDTRVYFGANNPSYSKPYTWKGYCGKS
jgi:hypothetical protein